MTIKEFNNKWLEIFARDVSKQDIDAAVLCYGGLLWHIFSYELIPKDSYLEKEKARESFDKIEWKKAMYILPFEENAETQKLTLDMQKAESLDCYEEIYVVANDFSWTYIKTHENDWGLGPYFKTNK
jgi:hypothetical protein